jgi:hypothetical protein
MTTETSTQFNTSGMVELSTSEMAGIEGGFGLLLLALTAFYIKGTDLGAF